MTEDRIELRLGGKIFTGWKDVRITRGIDRAVSDFDIEVSEKFPDAAAAASAARVSPIKIFGECVVAIAGEPVLTGFVDSYLPTYAATQHAVRVTGRSKTQDLIDCAYEAKGGQFNGYKLDAIARAVAEKFKLEVVVEADIGAPFPDVQREHHETAFHFIERLARLREILLTDDEGGRLVLTRAGSKRAPDRLVQGQNILRAAATISGADRFSEYIVKSQAGESAGGSSAGLALNDIYGNPVGRGVAQSPVRVGGQGVARDDGVPRYRPHVTIADSQLDKAGMQKAADWLMRFHKAKGTQTHITVQGWRQRGGELWKINQLVSVKSDYLQLDEELLIAAVTYELDDREGRRTTLTLGPVDAYTPDPREKHKKRAGHGGGAAGGLHLEPNAETE